MKYTGLNSHFLKVIYPVVISDISSKFPKVKLEFWGIISSEHQNVYGKINVTSEK